MSKHATYGSLLKDLKIAGEQVDSLQMERDNFKCSLFNERAAHRNTKQALDALVKHHVDKESAELEHSLGSLLTFGQVGIEILRDECCRGQVFGFHIRTAELHQMSTAYRAEYLELSIQAASKQLADLITKHFMTEMKIKTKEIDGIDSRFRY